MQIVCVRGFLSVPINWPNWKCRFVLATVFPKGYKHEDTCFQLSLKLLQVMMMAFSCSFHVRRLIDPVLTGTPYTTV